MIAEAVAPVATAPARDMRPRYHIVEGEPGTAAQPVTAPFRAVRSLSDRVFLDPLAAVAVCKTLRVQHPDAIVMASVPV